MPTLAMTVDELNEFLGDAFPGAPRAYRVEHAGRRRRPHACARTTPRSCGPEAPSRDPR